MTRSRGPKVCKLYFRFFFKRGNVKNDFVARSFDRIG